MSELSKDALLRRAAGALLLLLGVGLVYPPLAYPGLAASAIALVGFASIRSFARCRYAMSRSSRRFWMLLGVSFGGLACTWILEGRHNSAASTGFEGLAVLGLVMAVELVLRRRRSLQADSPQRHAWIEDAAQAAFVIGLCFEFGGRGQGMPAALELRLVLGAYLVLRLSALARRSSLSFARRPSLALLGAGLLLLLGNGITQQASHFALLAWAARLAAASLLLLALRGPAIRAMGERPDGARSPSTAARSTLWVGDASPVPAYAIGLGSLHLGMSILLGDGLVSAPLRDAGILLLFVLLGSLALWQQRLIGREVGALRGRLRAAEIELPRLQALEIVGRLARGVAHDLGNYLTVIRSCSSLLRIERSQPEQLEEVADVLDRAGTEAQSLVGQLLEVGRRGGGEPRRVHVNELLADLERFLPSLLGSGIRRQVQLGAQLPAVLIDPLQLKRVILNLLINAREAMPGGGSLFLRTGRARRAHSLAGHEEEHVLIEVADSGVGMDPVTRAHVFDAEFSTKQAGRGGVGLAVSLATIEGAGGRIEIQSSAGEGSVFRVLLPTADREFALPSRGTAMVVDDEAGNRELIAALLRGEGFEVMEADSGEAALRNARRHRGRIDLLVTDMVMPGMAGPELVSCMERERPGLRALYVSAFAQDLDPWTGALLRGHPLVHKPLQSNKLIHCVDRLLRERN